MIVQYWTIWYHGVMSKEGVIDISRILAESPVFGVMPSTAWGELARVARVFRCRGRTVLHSAGQPASYLYHVVSGQLDLTSVSRDGEEGAVGSFGAGQWVTWLSPFDGRPTERDIHATNGSVILAFPLDQVRKAFEVNPQAYPHLLKEISKRFRAALRLQDAHMVVNRDQRVGQMLLMLAEFTADSHESRHARITRSALAQRAGCSRQTMYQVLTRLEEKGLVRLRYGGIELQDPRGLRAFCTP
jgi:CRP/FNR family transcriptional regulator, cyclic AMP receptor protein